MQKESIKVHLKLSCVMHGAKQVEIIKTLRKLYARYVLFLHKYLIYYNCQRHNFMNRGLLTTIILHTTSEICLRRKSKDI